MESARLLSRPETAGSTHRGEGCCPLVVTVRARADQSSKGLSGSVHELNTGNFSSENPDSPAGYIFGKD